MPHGKKCAVCLTFDFDAISLWLGTFHVASPTPLSRGEFGARVGIWRILDLLDRYAIKATFFVPGHTADTYPKTVKEIHGRGHEIAHHGYCHENPLKLEYEEEKALLKKAINSLKAITGEAPLGSRSPAWDLGPNTVKLLLENTFVYDSSMMADDFRIYKCRIGDKVSKTEPFRFGSETALLEIPVSWSLDDFPAFEPTPSATRFTPSSAVFEIWKEEFDYMYNNVEGGVYTLSMHPQVIGRGHRIMILEKLARYIQSCQDVWFARMIDVAEAWKEKH